MTADKKEIEALRSALRGLLLCAQPQNEGESDSQYKDRRDLLPAAIQRASALLPKR